MRLHTSISDDPGLILWCWPCQKTHQFRHADVERIVYTLGGMVPDAAGLSRDDPEVAKHWSETGRDCLARVLTLSEPGDVYAVDVAGGVLARSLW